MGDYYKLKKILIIASIILVICRIFKSSIFAVTEVDPKTDNNGAIYQLDNQFDTLSNKTINDQERYIMMFNYRLEDANFRNSAIATLRQIYNYMISTNPTRAIFFENYVGTGTNNLFVMRVIEVSSGTYTTSFGAYSTETNYRFAEVLYINQARSSACPSIVVDDKGVITQTITSGSHMGISGMLGIYNPNWLQVFEKAGIITNETDYTNLLNTINSNILNLNYDLRSIAQSLITNNQTISNTYNYLTNEDHQEEDELPINEIQTQEVFNFDEFYSGLNNILTNEDYQTKNFNLKLPNNATHIIAVDPNITYNFLTRIGNGVYLVNLIQALWYIAIFGIIIFDAKRMMNQVASGDFLNIMTDSSPVDNVVSASFSATGAINIGTKHSGGDR